MKARTLIAAFTLCLVTIPLPVLSAPKKPVKPASTVKIPGPGTSLGTDYINTFIRPKLPVGTTWKYIAQHKDFGGGHYFSDVTIAVGPNGVADVVGKEPGADEEVPSVAAFSLSMLAALMYGANISVSDWKPVGADTITVKAGTFKQLSKVEVKSSDETTFYWYSPNIGLIRRTSTYGGRNPGYTVIELADFKLGKGRK